MTNLRTPFPWFGGKRRVAAEVWAGLGYVANYIEPFAGSLAVLLARPPRSPFAHETVNDADGLVTNFWRAVKADPAAVAHWCADPLHEIDLHARHMWLLRQGIPGLRSLLASDPDAYDPKVAGWWAWGQSGWIAAGWCQGSADDAFRPCPAHGQTLPHLGGGRGVLRVTHLPTGMMPPPWEPAVVGEYLGALAARLQRVRVCSGDWSRVVTRGATAYGATVGVFLDPPYLGEVRTHNLYTVDDHTIAHDVRDWCLEHGDDPRFRIVLAGYQPEHDALIPPTWRRYRWHASPAYASHSSTANRAKRTQETLWFSPHCLDPTPTLFGGGTGG